MTILSCLIGLDSFTSIDSDLNVQVGGMIEDMEIKGKRRGRDNGEKRRRRGNGEKKKYY